jgi:hypothetical protein
VKKGGHHQGVLLATVTDDDMLLRSILSRPLHSTMMPVVLTKNHQSDAPPIQGADAPLAGAIQLNATPEDITEEIISEPVVDKPPFVPPEKNKGEHKTAYKARVEYFRKLYEGEEVSEYSMRRYGKNSNK